MMNISQFFEKIGVSTLNLPKEALNEIIMECFGNVDDHVLNRALEKADDHRQYLENRVYIKSEKLNKKKRSPFKN